MREALGSSSHVINNNECVDVWPPLDHVTNITDPYSAVVPLLPFFFFFVFFL